jgi:hypothetical protein
MEAVFYVMAIMGCADGASGCAEARVMPVRYATPQACMAAAPDMLARNSDLSFPVISAACKSNGMIAAERKQARTDARG